MGSPLGEYARIALAKKYNFPLLPVFMWREETHGSFYFASYVNKQLRDVSQLNELLIQRGTRRCQL
jgi:lauroyl/myristoyl acyltransferase